MYGACEFYVSKNPDGTCLKLQKIGVGFWFFQYSITPILHKFVEEIKASRAPFQGAIQCQVSWVWILYAERFAVKKEKK